MTTGWRSAREARRPHAGRKLRRRHPNLRASKARRRSVRDSLRALRMKGLP